MGRDSVTWVVRADNLPFIPGLENVVGDVTLVFQHQGGITPNSCCEVTDVNGGHWAVQREHPGEPHDLAFHPSHDLTMYCKKCGEDRLAAVP